jgi:dTDP-L-rhamnose 4-epimerase
MNILITGGAGFIGAHLTRHLLTHGHSVTVLDNFLPQVHGEKQSLAADLAPHVRLIFGDIADETVMRTALDGAECIVHLAAETGTGQSMYQVTRYGRTNLMGTSMLFDLLVGGAADKLQRIVVASSRAIYGEGAYHCNEHGLVYPSARSTADKERSLFDPLCPVCRGDCVSVPTPETAPLSPSSWYGLTKQMQEQMTLMFAPVLGVSAFALRYQNVYGPGQSLSNPYTGILAVFSNLAREGKPIRVFEDGKESRDFVFIDDVVQATGAAIESPLADCHSVNVGSGKRTTVLEVAEGINAFYEGRSSIAVTGAFREGDIRHGLADLTEALRLLDYRPRWQFADGLRRFLAWASESGPSDGGYERSLAEMREKGLLRG